MDIRRQFQNLTCIMFMVTVNFTHALPRKVYHANKCNPAWCFPSTSKETNELLRQCVDLPLPEITTDIDVLIQRSKEFPVPFPIESVRLQKLRERRPLEDLKKNIASTYPLIHERVLMLMTHFLIHKREFGSCIEKPFYKDMTVPQLIDRILKKRAVSFLSSRDTYKLLSMDEINEGGWESVGTLQQRPPLLLENCLSYDEMKLAAMVYVSGHTEFINDGARTNAGIIDEDNIERNGVIIGLIGARLERKFQMEYEDLLITEEQNCPENGYGDEVTPTTCLNVLKTTYVRNNNSAKHMWRQMWSEFYQVQSYTYSELMTYVNIQEKSDEQQLYTDRYVRLKNEDAIFDNEVFFKRLSIPFDASLLEANYRAEVVGKVAFLNVIGIGLGVWKVSNHQTDVFILTFLERVRYLLKKEMLNHVSDVNFAYIKPSASIKAMFTSIDKDAKNVSKNEEKCVFFESKKHPNGGINVQLFRREPSTKLSGRHEGKLLVTTYPWDGNAHPGNEFWIGSLKGSGDPAAACSSQVAELHNAHVNAAVSANNARVVGTHGLLSIQDYCRKLLVDT